MTVPVTTAHEGRVRSSAPARPGRDDAPPAPPPPASALDVWGIGEGGGEGAAHEAIPEPRGRGLDGSVAGRLFEQVEVGAVDVGGGAGAGGPPRGGGGGRDRRA